MCDLRLHTLLSAAVQGGEMLEETGGGEGVYAITVPGGPQTPRVSHQKMYISQMPLPE